VSQRDQQGAPREERGQPRPFEPFPVLSSERIYDSPWCGLRRDWLDLGDSGDEPQEYHVFEIGDAVSVLPLLEDGSILLIGQYRHPTGQTRWELPAGRIGEGEAPELAARRELLEETGHAAARLLPLPGFYPTGGISAHYAHCFCAVGCVREAELSLEPSERIIVQTFRADDVAAMLAAGDIVDAFALIPLLYYLHFGARLLEADAEGA